MDHDTDTGIFEGIFAIGDGGSLTNFADSPRRCRRILIIFERENVVLATNHSHFGADPYPDPYPGIFNGIL